MALISCKHNEHTILKQIVDMQINMIPTTQWLNNNHIQRFQ
jgi:hypothetical protein